LDKIRKYVPENIRIISQGEYVASSLRNYMERHPEMDSRCTKGGTCRYYTTESVETFLPNASIFLNSAIDADSVAL
jgi:glutamate racemase